MTNRNLDFKVSKEEMNKIHSEAKVLNDLISEAENMIGIKKYAIVEFDSKSKVELVPEFTEIITRYFKEQNPVGEYTLRKINLTSTENYAVVLITKDR